jgi:hypothetical protein
MISIECCNKYCISNPSYTPTAVLPPFWECKYHRFLTSLLTRQSSQKRPRLIREYQKPDGSVVVAVYIGSPDQFLEKFLIDSGLLDNPKPYLSYVVFLKGLDMLVYDARSRQTYKIDYFDQELVWRRLRDDFFKALKNGKHEIIRREQKQAPLLSLEVS